MKLENADIYEYRLSYIKLSVLFMNGRVVPVSKWMQKHAWGEWRLGIIRVACCSSSCIA